MERIKAIKDLTKKDMDMVCTDHIANCNKCPLFLGDDGHREFCANSDTALFKKAIKIANKEITIKPTNSRRQ